MSRIKVPLPTRPVLATRDDAELVLNELALGVNNHRKLVARRDAYVLEVQQRYAADLAQISAKVQEQTEQLQAWAEANPGEFPNGLKSIRMSAGVIGFRTGTPKLALLSRAFTWDKVLAALQASAQWAGFIRTKAEVDKDAILGAHSQVAQENRAGVDAELKSLGLKVTQDESFYVDPLLTDTDARQTESAR